mmetsp:Transcript_12747/g.30500  ORF Transcript_12747/g.30500 Transcript_12747/m.30500 type:complete len:434 (-) Transcript_12747:68-1369(-)
MMRPVLLTPKEELVQRTVQIPHGKASRLVGHKGRALEELRTAAACRIDVGFERGTCIIQGDAGAVARAVDAVEQICAGGTPGDVVAQMTGAVVLHGDDVEINHVLVLKKAFAEQYGVHLEPGRGCVRLWRGRATTDRSLQAAVEAVKAEFERAPTQGITILLRNPRSNTGFYLRGIPALRRIMDVPGCVRLAFQELPSDDLQVSVSGPQMHLPSLFRWVVDRWGKNLWVEHVQVAEQLLAELAEHEINEFCDAARDAGAEVEVWLSAGCILICGAEKSVVEAALEACHVHLAEMLPDHCAFLSRQGCAAAAGQVLNSSVWRPDGGHLVMMIHHERDVVWLSSTSGRDLARACKDVERKAEINAESYFEAWLDHRGQALRILGNGGANISKLEKETGATIRTCPNQLWLTIAGSASAVSRGMRAVEGLIGIRLR